MTKTEQYRQEVLARFPEAKFKANGPDYDPDEPSTRFQVVVPGIFYAIGGTAFHAWKCAAERVRPLVAKESLDAVCAVLGPGFTVNTASDYSKLLDIHKSIMDWLCNTLDEHDAAEDAQFRRLASRIVNIVPFELQTFYGKYGTLDRWKL